MIMKSSHTLLSVRDQSFVLIPVKSLDRRHSILLHFPVCCSLGGGLKVLVCVHHSPCFIVIVYKCHSLAVIIVGSWCRFLWEVEDSMIQTLETYLSSSITFSIAVAASLVCRASSFTKKNNKSVQTSTKSSWLLFSVSSISVSSIAWTSTPSLISRLFYAGVLVAWLVGIYIKREEPIDSSIRQIESLFVTSRLQESVSQSLSWCCALAKTKTNLGLPAFSARSCLW